MPTGISSNFSSKSWVFRIRPPAGPSLRRIGILIHGWTGDENSMEIFASSLPPDFMQVFPRGPIMSPGGGYGWVAARSQSSFPGLEQFQTVCAQFIDALDEQVYSTVAPNMPVDLIGFSQGAAMCYALALLYPHRFQRVAALAGFLPEIPHGFDLTGVKTISFLIAHGTRDETIPVEAASRSAKILSAAGASVDYCESDTGHKLAAECFKRLKSFLYNVNDFG